MPRNSTGTIQVNVDVDTYTPKSFNSVPAGGVYEFGAQDSTVRFRSIPANASGGVGLIIVLPDDPSDGDCYEWVDADGTCALGHAVAVLIDDEGATGRTFGGVTLASSTPLSAIGATQPNSGARFQFDSEHNQWLVFYSSNPLVQASQIIAGTVIGGGPVAPDNFAGAGNEILFALLMPNKPETTFFAHLDAMISCVLSAADADLEFDISVVPDVTAFSGGGQVGGGTAPTMRYQTGSAVVVTGGTPVQWGSWKKQVATGEIGHQTATLATDVAIPERTVSNSIGAAIVVKVSTAAAALSAMSLSANAYPLGA